jgi:adenylyltransferase/sulfurtransferase
VTFTDDELERYARHIVLREVGGAGQQRLKAARVLVVGAGGIGAPALLYLAAAGIGTLGVVDDDRVGLANLQRQVIHSTEAVGRPKTASAAQAIGRLNPHVAVEPHALRLTEVNAPGLVAGHDAVLDGSDNFATRYAVSDACFAAAVPLVSAAVGRFDAQITTLAPHLAGPDGAPNPTYRCLYPAPPPEGTVPACEEAGILGALTGVAGTIAAAEVLKLILGLGRPLIGRLLLVDLLELSFEEIGYGWDPANPLNGTAPDRIR